jgi:hypothetical protein
MIWTFKAAAVWKTKNMKLKLPAFLENMAMNIQIFTTYILSRQKPSMILSIVGVLNWVGTYNSVTIAETQGMHTTPVVTGTAPNANISIKSSGLIS